MFQALSIIALVLAIGLPLLDLAVFRPRRRAAAPADAAIRGAEWAIYLLFLIALLGMVVSSILMLAIGERMHRWMLIVHMSIAPLFAICIAALALLWADMNASPRTPAGTRLAFWMVLASALVTIVSALLGMMTWFGSFGQETLLNLHRISAMVLIVAAACQAGRLLLSGEGRADAPTANH